MFKPYAAAALAVVLLAGAVAGTASAAPTYGLSVGDGYTNPFTAEDR